jgi:hypothetical protein
MYTHMYTSHVHARHSHPERIAKEQNIYHLLKQDTENGM